MLIHNREAIIATLYQSELMREAPSGARAFETAALSAHDSALVDALARNYSQYVAAVQASLAPAWTFARLSALERAALVWGAYELEHNPRGMVINELVNYAKEYLPGETYKYFNRVLDNISKLKEQSNAPREHSETS